MTRTINRAISVVRVGRVGVLAALAIAVGSTAAASEKDRPRTPPPPTPGPAEAVIYIYRTQSTALAGRGATFFVDGVKVVTLGYHGCTAVVVPAGSHVLKQTWPLDISFGRSSSFSADWQAGQSYYYRFDVDSQLLYPTIIFRWRTDELNAGGGQDAVSDCRYTPPFDLAKLKPQAPK